MPADTGRKRDLEMPKTEPLKATAAPDDPRYAKAAETAVQLERDARVRGSDWDQLCAELAGEARSIR